MTWPITDNFNRANQVGLGAMSDGVHNWTITQGAIDIVTNQAKVTAATGGSIAVVTETHTETDYYVQALCYGASARDPGVVARYISTTQFYFFRGDGSSVLQLYKYNSGYTLLGSMSLVDATRTLKLQVSGSTLRCYYDGTEATFSPVTDATFATGKPGIRGYYNADTWDGFEADFLAAAGITKLLDTELMGGMQEPRWM